MALVNIDRSIKRICGDLEKLDPPAGIEILTYKRNRGVAVLRIDRDRFQVRERGYNEEVWEVKGSGLPRLLKAILKREFPRSRKVRVYSLSGPDQLDQERKKL